MNSHSSITLPPKFRSALGIKRISDVDVSQVLHATQEDVQLLRTRLRKWGVPKFQSYSLLLRALTHSSISNWAERILDLPKRSLGSNTLELLGDRVVGTCTAHHVLQWTRQPATCPKIDWMGGPRTILKSLTGNRGMAETARDIGIESLVRWEKPAPPSAFRSRVDSLGIDLITGVQSNVEINALAACYESVAAAIYLDGGINPARSFINDTLLTCPIDIQRSNRDTAEYETILSRELAALFGTPIMSVSPRSRTSPKHVEHGRVRVDILDFEQTVTADTNEAHILFYTGIFIRQSSNATDYPTEVDLISLASHFSVETARLAALTQAISILRGHSEPNTEAYADNSRDETIIQRKIPAATAPSLGPNFSPRASTAPFTLSTKLNAHGQWKFDRDYVNLAGVLSRAGLRIEPSIASSGTKIRKHLQSLSEQQSHVKDEFSKRNVKGTMMDQSGGVLGVHGLSHSSRNSDARSDVDESSVARALKIGREVILESNLSKSHENVVGDAKSALDVVQCLDNAIDEMSSLNRIERANWAGGFHGLGNETFRLWAAQRSITNVGQDRAEVIPQFERRLGLANALERQMIGSKGLSVLRDLGVRKGYVALGICAADLGTSTALAWLTGHEASRRLG